MMLQKNNFVKQTQTVLAIIWLGFITGTLDAIATIIWNFILNDKIITALIFKFIAYGAFGKAALNSGNQMVVAGGIFHYLIAFLFSLVFYLGYPFCIRIFKNKYLTAIFYGVAAWVIMNLMVIPLSKIGYHVIKPQIALAGIVILVICIGLPIVLIADRNLERKNF